MRPNPLKKRAQLADGLLKAIRDGGNGEADDELEGIAGGPGLREVMAAEPPAAGSVSDHHSRSADCSRRRTAEKGRGWIRGASGWAGPAFLRDCRAREHSAA